MTDTGHTDKSGELFFEGPDIKGFVEKPERCFYDPGGNPIEAERPFNIANIITGIRIVCSIALLFCPLFSQAFYALYLTAGISDMIDGTVARKTRTVSALGSKLDSAADFILIAVCLIKMIPALHIPMWLVIWIIAIAAIRAANLVYGYVKQKEPVVLHTVMNKVTGILLFVLPLTFPFIDLRYSGAIVSAAATFAAVQEGYLIRAGHN